MGVVRSKLKVFVYRKGAGIPSHGGILRRIPRSRDGKRVPPYGRPCRRPVPEKVDEVIEVPLPETCPQCGSELKRDWGGKSISDRDSPAQVERIEFRIHQGCCQGCGRLATQSNKGLGLPYSKVTQVLEQVWGLKVSRSGLCRANNCSIHRLSLICLPHDPFLGKQIPKNSEQILITHDGHDHCALPAADIAFQMKDLLPRAENRLAVSHGNR